MNHRALSLTALLAVLGAAQAQTTLTVASWKGGGGEIAAFPELIAKFEREHPGVKVQLQYAGRNDLVTALNAKIQAGEAPDVMMVDRVLMKNWASAGVLADLSNEAWVAQLRPDLVDTSRLDGRLYLFPMELIGMGVFVNMDLLKKAGVSRIPLTLSDYKSACAALKRVGATPLLLPAKDGWTPGVWATVLGVDEAQRGNRSFVRDVQAGKASFGATPAFTKALGSLRELADAGCYDPKLNLGVDPWSTGLDEFRAGRVGFLPQGAWNIQAFKPTPGLNFQFAPFPALSGSKGVGANFLGTSWAINAKAKNAAAARQWVAFWAKDENLKLFLTAEGASSTLRGGTSGLSSLAQPYANAEKAGRVFVNPEGYWRPELTDTVAKSMTSFLLNVKQDPSATLQRWDAANK